ncbi:MAG: CoB--CoM heterodisulfide reductase subunit E [Methanosaeta sp. PtaB.Bin039]|nr:MAG: CoB--CoM heterodisulfide reductase subunit E [Methanosaeta sp. PtaB.Bin039]OPY44407.1 MAG: CoB--CoM heterodisulfide reductase subunit E [Methanosaeta sp. PtaU1.Bin028]HOT07133.1 respiratory nitrate reductase subunit gamma [Methanotrichaceae archaeon]HQF17077.1 respiratory nitrate reductase subunit gamma [Methanotrichaceae archaeon]HQI91698.1 respiratory nitrate reductase subunit gamma [Methanotrichaceae archaeon]
MAFYTLGLTFSIVIALTVVVLGIWLYGLYFNFKKWGLGSTGYTAPLANSFWLFIATWIHEAFKDGIWVFIRTLVLDVFLLRRTLRRSPVRWVMHMTIFYGFAALAALSGLGLMMDILEQPFMSFLGLAHQAEIVKESMALPFDLFGYLLLIGTTISVLRRILLKEVRDATTAYDVVLVGGVFLITITGFYAEWMRGNAFLVGDVFSNTIYAPHFALIHTVLALALFAFILPWTRYIHVVAAPMTILANRGGE